MSQYQEHNTWQIILPGNYKHFHTQCSVFILQLIRCRLFGLVPECRTLSSASLLWIATEVHMARDTWGQVRTVEDRYEQA